MSGFHSGAHGRFVAGNLRSFEGDSVVSFWWGPSAGSWLYGVVGVRRGVLLEG